MLLGDTAPHRVLDHGEIHALQVALQIRRKPNHLVEFPAVLLEHRAAHPGRQRQARGPAYVGAREKGTASSPQAGCR